MFKIDCGVLNDFGHKAYWLQFWKIRIGVFVSPRSALWGWDIKKCYDLGWMMAAGPFQVCYYRFALEDAE